MNKDITQIRDDFPILEREINGYPLIYLDNAATTQKPQSVIDAVSHVYSHSYANIHRGLHTMAHEASELYENTKKKLLTFVNAANNYSVIFTKNMTEASNLVAFSYLSYQKDLHKKIILTSGQEHHSNFLPWLRMSQENGYSLELIPTLNNGDLDQGFYNEFLKRNADKIAMICLSTASNVFGILSPIEDMVKLANEYSIPTFIDGAQTVGHVRTNLASVSPSFFAASAHKMYAPAGVGFLFIRKDLINSLKPFIVGGGMVSSVSEDSYQEKDSEEKLIGGTPNIEGIAGLASAIEYIESLGIDTIATYENSLVTYFQSKIENYPYLNFIGDPYHKRHIGLFSFSSKLHPHDIADYLDTKGIAVRAGGHCAYPLHSLMGETSSTRVSFGLYTTTTEIDSFFDAISEIHSNFGIS
jgi:cysteine desulfurase/selenocysteine lyase